MIVRFTPGIYHKWVDQSDEDRFNLLICGAVPVLVSGLKMLSYELCPVTGGAERLLINRERLTQ